MAQVFISYKRDHPASEAIVEALRAALTAAGHQALVDVAVRAGQQWSPELYRWLLGCAGAVALVSEDAQASPWCQREWAVLHARHHAQRTRVVPVAVDVERDRIGLLGDLQSVDGAQAVEAVVDAVLAGLTTLPAADVVTADDYLALHRAWLRHLYDRAPVLKQEGLTLASIHAPLECDVRPWREAQTSRETRGPRPTEDALSAALRYVCDPSFRDVVVVQAAAGAGKSTFMLRLARELEDRGLQPVLIRFRDLRVAEVEPIEKKLADAIELGPEQESPPLPDAPILDELRLRQTWKVDGHEICRTVFLLDGWDEVSLASTAGYQESLKRWLPQLREYLLKRKGPPVRLVVSGRPSRDVERSGLLADDTTVLALRPFTPEALAAFVERVQRHAPWPAVDLGDQLREYMTWYRAGTKDAGSSYELLGFPLLAFLTCQAYALQPTLDRSLVGMPTLLYKALIDETIHGGRAKADPLHGQTVHLRDDPLRRLMRITAVVATLTSSDRVRHRELAERVRRLDAPELLTDVDEELTSALVVSYWFKGQQQDHGCEFIHKSFREYLYAEAIVEELRMLAGGARGPQPATRHEYWQDFVPGSTLHRASRRLTRVLGATWLSSEVRTHLFALLDRELPDAPDHWLAVRDVLVDVYAWWAEGVHLRPQARLDAQGRQVASHSADSEPSLWSPPFVVSMAEWAMALDPEARWLPIRTATVDGTFGDALMQICAFFHARLPHASGADTSHRHYRSSAEGERCRFRPGGRKGKYFRQLVSRIDAASVRPHGPRASGLWLESVDLSEEHLAGERFARANLRDALLRGADLRGARLAGTSLYGADLDGADLRGATVIGAQLYDCDTDDPTVVLFRNPVASWRGARLPSHLAALVYDGDTEPPSNWRFDVVRGKVIGGATMFGSGEQEGG